MKVLRGLSLEKLIDILQDSTIILFGAGIQGKRVLLYIDGWGLGKNVVGVLDNNIENNTLGLEYRGGSLPVYKPKDLWGIWDCKTIILVASIYYEEIFKQLKRIDRENKLVVVSIDEVADIELEYDRYQILKESERPLIPKVIHYAWFGSEKPKDIQKNIDKWKCMCQDYDFYEWNEYNYDIKKNKYMWQTYEMKMWGFVPDYLRLDVLFKYGGIYLDTDIELIKKPDELLYQKCFASVDASLTMNLGSGFGCEPGSVMIKELRDYYNTCSIVDKHGNIDKTSCNTHSYRVLKKYGYIINNRLQTIGDMNIYPMSFQGKNQYTGKCSIANNTAWIHHGNMSWL